MKRLTDVGELSAESREEGVPTIAGIPVRKYMIRIDGQNDDLRGRTHVEEAKLLMKSCSRERISVPFRRTDLVPWWRQSQGQPR